MVSRALVAGVASALVATNFMALPGRFGLLNGVAGATGTTRVVAPTGSDANPGTADAPYRTLTAALRALAPGDTLLVRGGTYVENVMPTVAAGGATSPITVRAYPGETPVLQGLLWLHNADWWTFDGLNVTWNPANLASQHMVKFTDGGHWRFTNAEVWGAHSYAAILVAGSPADWSLDHLFVHDTYTSNATNQDHLIYVNANSGGTGGLIERNLLVRSANGRAVKVGPSAAGAGTVANLTIRFNTMVDNLGPSNIQLAWSATDVRMTRNLFDHPADNRSAITAYELTGTGNVAGDNLAWNAPRVLDTGVAGLADGGGNLLADPVFTNRTADDFHPTNPAAQAYGVYSPLGVDSSTTTTTTTSSTAPSTTTTAPTTTTTAPTAPLPPTPLPSPVGGYRLAAADGGIFAFGNETFAGSAGGIRLNAPIVGIANTESRNGYWLTGSDGGIFAFGDAVFSGSTGGTKLNKPIVGIARAGGSSAYWLVGSDGGIFAFGGAPFLGSTGGRRLNQPIVGMTATPTGRGYWLVARDGGIFAFGDAVFAGSTGAIKLNDPIVGMATTPTGRGYWLVGRDGGIFAFGDAVFAGSTGGLRLNRPIVGIAPSGTGSGYLLAAADGGVFAFGDAVYAGSAGTVPLNSPIIGIAR